MPSSTPATSRAMGPTVSKLGDSGHTPSSGTRPHVVFSPEIPQHAAGMRIEPPVSVPYTTSASPAATAVAEPLDEPPGTRRGSSGFTGVPYHGLMPVTPRASSCRLVRPTIRAPAPRAPARQAASRGAAHLALLDRGYQKLTSFECLNPVRRELVPEIPSFKCIQCTLYASVATTATTLLNTPVTLTRQNNFGIPNNDGSQPDGTNARRLQVAFRLKF